MAILHRKQTMKCCIMFKPLLVSLYIWNTTTVCWSAGLYHFQLLVKCSISQDRRSSVIRHNTQATRRDMA